jgi:hypothetical protein
MISVDPYSNVWTDELLLLQEKQLAYKAVLNVADEELKDKQKHEVKYEDTIRCI